MTGPRPSWGALPQPMTRKRRNGHQQHKETTVERTGSVSSFYQEKIESLAAKLTDWLHDPRQTHDALTYDLLYELPEGVDGTEVVKLALQQAARWY